MTILDDLQSDVTNTLKNEVSNAELIKESGTVNIASGTTNTVENVYSGTGFSQSISEQYMDENVVPKSMREIVLFQTELTDAQGNQIEPEQGDEVKINGIRYRATIVDQDPASTVWIVVGQS